MIAEIKNIQDRLDAIEKRVKENQKYTDKETAVQIGRFIALYERIVWKGNAVTIGALSILFDNTKPTLSRMLGVVRSSTVQPELKDRVDAVVKYCDKTPDRNLPAATMGAFFLGYKKEKEFLASVPAPAKKSRMKFK